MSERLKMPEDLTDVEEEAVAQLIRRQHIGRERYGQGVQHYYKDWDPERWLQEAIEECADMLQYLCAAKIRIEDALAAGLPNGGEVWIAASIVDSDNKWELNGIFLTKDAARSVCSDPNDFIAPMKMGENVKDKHGPFPGAEFPCEDSEED